MLRYRNRYRKRSHVWYESSFTVSVAQQSPIVFTPILRGSPPQIAVFIPQEVGYSYFQRTTPPLFSIIREERFLRKFKAYF